MINKTMSTSTEDFFISSNSIHDSLNDDYWKVDLVISVFNAMSRTTYQSLYIIDYFRKDFLYVSENPLFLCGHSAEEIKKLGYLFYINHVPEQEQRMLTEVNKAGFNFFDRIPVDERINYSISYDFHILTGKKKMLINHKLTPILLTKDGRIWLAACVVSISSHNTIGHVELRKAGSTSFWEYSLDSHKWCENSGITLGEKERDILSLSAQGYTMNEIADELCLAIDTIKFYKRKLFEKLNVKNIAEAISFATNYKLL